MRKNADKGRYFEDISSARSHHLSLARGSQSDRLVGLDKLLGKAPGAKVLDLGCYMGWVAEAFAARGAAVVDAVDLYLPGVESTKALLAQHDANFRVEKCDLRGGYEALKMALPGYESYDIVLYLGLHHHLRRSLNKDTLDAFVSTLSNRTATYFALRTKEEFFPDVETVLTSQNFALWDVTPKTNYAGRLSVYKRIK